MIASFTEAIELSIPRRKMYAFESKTYTCQRLCANY